MKTSIDISKVKTHINLAISVGDQVKLIDGSGLTLASPQHGDDGEVFIVNAYYYLTHSKKPLKELSFKVIETSVTNHILLYDSANKHIEHSMYLQDILIEVNGTRFRTCSAFVQKLNPGSDRGILITRV